MKAAGIFVFCVAILALGGCATPPQQPIPLASDALSSKNTRFGVAMPALPKVDTYLPGADCLLCMAVASAANSALTTHTRTLPYESLPRLKHDVADLIRKKGGEAMVIGEDLNLAGLPDYASKGPNIPKKDFSVLGKKYPIDKLVVLDVFSLGVQRTYAAYIPTSEPKGVLNGAGYIVNLSNNTYEWYLPVSISKSAEGKWDEPPKFPGVTNAYFQALELGRDEFLKPFGQ